MLHGWEGVEAWSQVTWEKDKALGSTELGKDSGKQFCLGPRDSAEEDGALVPTFQ